MAAVVAALAAVGAWRRTGWLRCVACATAGAVAFGLVSTLVRAISQEVATGVSALLDLRRAGHRGRHRGGRAGIGGWLVQQAFALRRRPRWSSPASPWSTRSSPCCWASLLLGEGAATPAATWPLLVTAAIAATAGVLALARHHPDAVGPPRAGPAAHPGPSPGAAAPPIGPRDRPARDVAAGAWTRCAS